MIGVGSKVVCIEDCNPITPCGFHGTAPNGCPQKGKIYVVSDIAILHNPTRIGLKLIGMPAFGKYGEASWESIKFRELEHEQMRSEMEYLRSLPVESPQPIHRPTRLGVTHRHE